MMSHPLYQKPANRFYLIIWSVISIGHFCIFYFFYNFSILASALDSLIFNTLYFGLGLGIWYLVRFNPLNKRLSRTILNHAISGVIAVILWASIGKSLIGILPIEDKAYENFLANSNLGRNLIGFALYALFSLSFYLIEHYESLQDRIREELELKALVNEAHLKSLKSQINPHFLFNSLNSINSLTLVSPEKTRDMVIKLSEFLRYSAGKQSQEHATLEEELRHMNIYLDIEKVRFGKKLDIKTSIDETCLKAKIPNFILQPLLENAIKYGVQESLDTKPITIKCSKSGTFLRIEVENQFDDTINAKGEGIGLNNIKARLKILYGRDGLIQMESANNLFKVIIEIPQENE
jgi:sensor histidine kinase YesM